MGVGIFDTGIGGLAVLVHLRKLGFESDILYFNDDGRFPYGEKGEEERLGYALEVARFLKDKEVQAISISCNTVVTFAKEAIAEDLQMQPFDVIGGALDKVNGLDPTPSKVLVIGSKVTCSSNIYSNNILQKDKNIQVFEVPFNDLIYTIEGNFKTISEEDIQSVVDSTIQELNPDVLVLACSHYSLVASHFQALYPHLQIIDPTFELALALFNEANTKVENGDKRGDNKIFYTGKKEGIVGLLQAKNIDNMILEKVNW